MGNRPWAGLGRMLVALCRNISLQGPPGLSLFLSSPATAPHPHSRCNRSKGRGDIFQLSAIYNSSPEM